MAVTFFADRMRTAAQTIAKHDYETSDEETAVDMLNGTEVEAFFAQERVDDAVEGGDHDDDRYGVQVLDENIGVPCNVIPAATVPRFPSIWE